MTGLRLCQLYINTASRNKLNLNAPNIKLLLIVVLLRGQNILEMLEGLSYFQVPETKLHSILDILRYYLSLLQ